MHRLPADMPCPYGKRIEPEFQACIPALNPLYIDVFVPQSHHPLMLATIDALRTVLDSSSDWLNYPSAWSWGDKDRDEIGPVGFFFRRVTSLLVDSLFCNTLSLIAQSDLHRR
jgi:hypothetical protein